MEHQPKDYMSSNNKLYVGDFFHKYTIKKQFRRYTVLDANQDIVLKKNLTFEQLMSLIFEYTNTHHL